MVRCNILVATMIRIKGGEEQEESVVFPNTLSGQLLAKKNIQIFLKKNIVLIFYENVIKNIYFE